MSCELYKSEIYAWRPRTDLASFQPLFDHLADCQECASLFARVTATDQHIQRTFQKLPEDRSLEIRILAGLAHQRAYTRSPRPNWRSWFLLPIAVAILVAIMLGARPWSQEAQLQKEVATLLSQPPALQFSSTDRKQILNWSASILSGFSDLPPELDRVQFQGAVALSVARHKAVLLKMKNEQRASLLIVDAPLTHGDGFRSIHENLGNASLWSDGRRTYALLFNGNIQEMHAYMVQMGIGA